MKPLRELFNWNDPRSRGRMLRFFWVVSLFMLVLGYLLIVYVFFFR